MKTSGLSTLTAFLIVLSAGSIVSAQDELPPGDGQETVARVCGECHGFAMITSYRKQSREGWEQVVASMMGYGAVASDAETKTIVEYLAKHFGTEPAPVASHPEEATAPAEAPDTAAAVSPTTPPEKLKVNKATSKEIEAFFKLSAKEAEDIFHYREEHGSFKDWQALEKVPGLDLKTLEKSKDRVTFDDKPPD